MSSIHCCMSCASLYASLQSSSSRPVGEVFNQPFHLLGDRSFLPYKTVSMSGIQIVLLITFITWPRLVVNRQVLAHWKGKRDWMSYELFSEYVCETSLGQTPVKWAALRHHSTLSISSEASSSSAAAATTSARTRGDPDIVPLDVPRIFAPPTAATWK